MIPSYLNLFLHSQVGFTSLFTFTPPLDARDYLIYIYSELLMLHYLACSAFEVDVLVNQQIFALKVHDQLNFESILKNVAPNDTISLIPSSFRGSDVTPVIQVIDKILICEARPDTLSPNNGMYSYVYYYPSDGAPAKKSTSYFSMPAKAFASPYTSDSYSALNHLRNYGFLWLDPFEFARNLTQARSNIPDSMFMSALSTLIDKIHFFQSHGVVCSTYKVAFALLTVFRRFEKYLKNKNLSRSYGSASKSRGFIQVIASASGFPDASRIFAAFNIACCDLRLY